MLPPLGLLLRPPGAIPQGMLSLDLNDPINVGLIGCWIPGISGGYDLTNNQGTAQFINTVPGFSPSPIGLGRNWTGVSAQALQAPINSGFTSTTAPLTIHACVVPANVNVQEQILSTAINATPYDGVWFGHGPGGFGSTVNGSIFYGRHTSSQYYYADTGLNTSVANALSNVFVIDTGGGSAAAITIMINGVVQALTKTGTASGTFTNRPWTIGNVTDGTSPFNGNIIIIRVWNVAKLVSDGVRLATKPFAGLISAPDRLPVWGAVGGGSTVTSTYALPNSDFLALISDRMIPFSDQLALTKDIALPLGDKLALAEDASLPLMSRLSIAADANAPLSMRVALAADADAPLGFRLSLSTDAALPIAGRIALAGDSGLPVAFRLTIDGTESLPLSAAGTVLTAVSTDASLPLAFRVILDIDTIVPTSTRLGLTQDSTQLIGTHLAVRGDSALPLSPHSALTADAALPTSARLDLVVDGRYPISTRLDLSADQSVVVAFCTALLADRSLAVSTLQRLITDESLPLSAAGVMNGVFSDAGIPLGTYLSLDADEALPVATQIVGSLLIRVLLTNDQMVVSDLKNILMAASDLINSKLN